MCCCVHYQANIDYRKRQKTITAHLEKVCSALLCSALSCPLIGPCISDVAVRALVKLERKRVQYREATGGDEAMAEEESALRSQLKKVLHSNNLTCAQRSELR